MSYLLRMWRILRVPVMCLLSRPSAIVLHLLRVLQIQANRLWTWLEGEEEESEKEEEEEASADDGDEEEEDKTEEGDEDEPAHGKKQAQGAPKKEHSEDEPEDAVVPEKQSASSAKAAQSAMLEFKQESQTMAEKKKQKLEERSTSNVPAEEVRGGVAQEKEGQTTTRNVVTCPLQLPRGARRRRSAPHRQEQTGFSLKSGTTVIWTQRRESWRQTSMRLWAD